MGSEGMMIYYIRFKTYGLVTTLMRYTSKLLHIDADDVLFSASQALYDWIVQHHVSQSPLLQTKLVEHLQSGSTPQGHSQSNLSIQKYLSAESLADILYTPGSIDHVQYLEKTHSHAAALFASPQEVSRPTLKKATFEAVSTYKTLWETYHKKGGCTSLLSNIPADIQFQILQKLSERGQPHRSWGEWPEVELVTKLLTKFCGIESHVSVTHTYITYQRPGNETTF